MYVVKGLVTGNAHMKYESPIYTGSEVMAKVKVFVQAHAYTNASGMTIALQTFVPVLSSWFLSLQGTQTI